MIVIMLLTYDRLEVARMTLESVAQHLSTSEEVWMHIADDGSSQEYRDELLDLAHEHYGDRVSITNSERAGYGGNYNIATQLVHQIADIMLPLEDDWELTRPLDIDPIVKALRDGAFGCVRMGYIGYTADLRGTLRWHEGLHWLEFDPDSPERHVFAGGPRLETVAFERKVGPWPERMEQGATEFDVAGRREAREGVAWPLDLIRPSGDAFAHIGSYKATELPAEAMMEAAQA
jgi:glycosyltransferase involved in cell wall biosynthesis